MIAITNPPGKARNLSLGFFGASAPIGGYLGGIIVGLFLKYSQIKWCFLFLALLSLTVFIPLFFLLPPEVPVDKHGTIDWVGAAFGTTALILFNFVWNQAPAVGWQTGYEIALLIVSLICFVAFLAWERWGTLEAILPLEIFKTPSFGPLMLVVLLNYMAFGTLLWYMIIWQQDLRARSVMQVAVGWTPFLVCGIGAAGLAAFLIPRLAAQWILAIGTATVAIASVILATMPARQSYWAQVFPATVIMSFCPDLVFTGKCFLKRFFSNLAFLRPSSGTDHCQQFCSSTSARHSRVVDWHVESVRKQLRPRLRRNGANASCKEHEECCFAIQSSVVLQRWYRHHGISSRCPFRESR